MSTAGVEVLEELRRRRAIGDTRVTPEGRAIFERVTSGDLAEAFAEALEDGSDADSLLSGQLDSDE